MARHTKVLFGTIKPESDETTAGSLSKAVNDLISGKTVISIAFSKLGYAVYGTAIVVYDDA